MTGNIISDLLIISSLVASVPALGMTVLVGLPLSIKLLIEDGHKSLCDYLFCAVIAWPQLGILIALTILILDVYK